MAIRKNIGAHNDTIPDNAVVFGGVVNSAAAVTASGSATVAIGTAAGGMPRRQSL